MKRNLVTLIGVIAIVACIVVVRGVFEQSPRTDADVNDAADAKEQLEKAAAITDEAKGDDGDGDMDEHAHAEDDGHDHGEEGHSHDDGHAHGEEGHSEDDGHDHGEEAKMVVAKADENAAGTAAPETPAEFPTFEEIAEWPAEAPDVFRVKFDSTAGPYVIEVNKEWAPIGAAHFYELCKVGFFNGAGYFRVITKPKPFMVQFGLAGADPKLTAQYRSKKLPDDPVRKSNQRGMVTFANSGAPNTRGTQLFINYGDNSFLDSQRFAPFGEVIAGMENVEKIYDGYQAESNNQEAISQKGSAFLKANFPRLDYVNNVSLVK